MPKEINSLLQNETWGMYLNNGVKNRRAHPITIPVTTPANPVFAPLSWLTADLEKEPTNYVKNKNKNPPV